MMRADTPNSNPEEPPCPCGSRAQPSSSAWLILYSGRPVPAAEAKRPNVVVILTDDQGYGDLGIHGNPVIKTPNLDQLGRDGTQLRQFHVMPVCSPTRACLMTGRYFYRTGVVDTYIGRSMMHPDEVTLAEMLKAGGYRTGIFGKWHLGDSAPLRPVDQGFEEALVHKGGGIGQPSDPPGGDHYFDATLLKNGKPFKTKGYCSDIYTSAALDFIDKADDRPFFAYLAFNAPHDPFEVPEEELAPYLKADLAPKNFPHPGQHLPKATNSETIAKVYGMVTNIDRNVGRLMARLKSKGIDRDTIVVYFMDNGPAFARYNAGQRGLKGSVYEGGTRVACFIRWPAGFKPGGHVNVPTAPIDLAPTLIAACGVAPPASVKFDGKSLLPLLKGELAESAWPDRVLLTQWHRGDAPERGRAFAARSSRYKLVQSKAVDPSVPIADAKPELFDVPNDPYEQTNLAGKHPEIVRELRQAYDRWYDAMKAERDFQPPRIAIGSDLENPVVLTRQDWRGPRAGWGPKAIGYWEVDVESEGPYDLRFDFKPGNAGDVRLKVGDRSFRVDFEAGADEAVLKNVSLPKGPARIEPVIVRGKEEAGVTHVEVNRLAPASK